MRIAVENLDRLHADNIRHDEAFRDLPPKHWREGRRLLRSLPEGAQTQMFDAWNRSCIPHDAAYFVDFVRTRLRPGHALP